MAGGAIELQEIKSNNEGQREGLGGYDDEEDDIEISLDNSALHKQ